MSKNPQDRNRVPGEGEGKDVEKMPRKEGGEQQRKSPTGGQQGGQGGQQGGQGGQTWNKEQQGQQPQGGQRQQGDPMKRQKDVDEETGDDRKRRPA